MPWQDWESAAIWTVMVGAFLMLGAWENWQPGREPAWPAESRWGRHGLLLLAGALLAAVFRLSPVAAAALVADQPWGLLNRPALPFALQFAAAILLLDLVHYGTHRLFHAVGFLWRIHEVHHSDGDYDVSTAARFHPLEVMLTKGLYLGAIALLAPPVSAVFFAELHTSLLNILVHANVTLPARWERWLRVVLITPKLHRTHHSLALGDRNRNFGQTFVWWDRLWATYLPESVTGHSAPVTGVAGAGTGAGPETSVWYLLAAPFRRRAEKKTKGPPG